MLSGAAKDTTIVTYGGLPGETPVRTRREIPGESFIGIPS